MFRYHIARLSALALALAACRGPAGSRAALSKLSTELARALEQSPSDAPQRVLVDLVAQLDLAALEDTLARHRVARTERRRRVVAALAAVAESSQGALIPLLERLKRDRTVVSYEMFTVVNRVLVVATPRAIRTLAGSSDVAAITGETAPQATVLAAAPAARWRPVPPTRSWAVEQAGAERLWRRGLRGRGVVVGIIDAGASAEHEQLRATYRGGPRSWYDPSGRSAAPLDQATGHGTAVLSAAVAANEGGKIIGIAPGARWVACVGLPDGRYNNVAFTQCADWMLTTAAPDVLINAWLLPAAGCDRSLARVVAAWRLAGMLPVFAAGNRGPAPGSDGSPANYGLSVGGVMRSGRIVESSGRGPNSCDGSVFPSLVAPAESVPVAFPLTPSAYLEGRGTSIAAGFVAGAAALLLERYPQASVPVLERSLRLGARRPASGRADDTYGYGALEVAATLDSLARLVASPAAPSKATTPAAQR